MGVLCITSICDAEEKSGTPMSGTVISNVILGIVSLGAVAFYVLVFRPALKRSTEGRKDTMGKGLGPACCRNDDDDKPLIAGIVSVEATR